MEDLTKKITGGEAIYQVLRDQGIKTVFGLLGGSMLELYDAMYQHKEIDYVGARDERAAGHMADAYARMTGGPGIVLGAQAGPGVVNLATAVAEAHLAYSPLVAIAGAISRSDLGKDTFQEIDQVALFAPISKKSVMVTDPSRLAEMLQDAIRLSMSGRRGPVVLHVPRDLMSADVEPSKPGPIRIAKAGPPPSTAVAEIIQKLSKAKQPVIVAGGGFKWSDGSASLKAMVEQLNVPVVASTGHADVMPHAHPLYAGQGGPRGNTVASGLTKNADFLLVLGARLAFNSTFFSNDYISDNAEIVHVDIEAAAIGRYFPATLALQADAKETAEAITAEAVKQSLKSKGWQAWLDAFERNYQALLVEREVEANNDAMPMHPRRALAEIRKALPENAIVTIDTGNACLQSADRLAHYQTPGLITPLDFGLVGFGYAAAIGAAAAAPGRPVVSIMGDGGFGFTMAEITTAVRYNLPVIAVILDNGAWGAEKAYQQEFFGGRLLGAEIDSPAYNKVAELSGAKGYAVNRPDELASTLREALILNAPTVIHVKIDPNSLNTLRKDLFSKK
ncbi:thiamine pyrophosphate-binding protein [Alphaproteobacteria bacterium]|nr:thiamine pyrophosphate-binding protein [Alphaproteobacteria bacterium]